MRARVDRGGAPLSWTSFIGRSAELADLWQVLDEATLVTVTGPGGCGKTRLVREGLSSEAMIFADLGAVDSGVALVVLRSLGVDQAPGETALDSCVRHFAGEPATVVLDNCEHVLDEAATVAEALVKASDSVRVVATSRAPLRAPGERVLGLLPLSADDAVLLFEERARDAGSAPASREAVAELCDRIDCLPLAIEIAAARTANLSVGDLLAEWDAWPRLLAGRRADAARHFSVEECIAWSIRSLPEVERKALRGASVFRSPFTLDAAKTVLGPDAVTTVPALAEKSLLSLTSGPTGPRYRMFKLVQSVAGRELQARPAEELIVRHRHLVRLADLAQESEPEFAGSRLIETIAELRAELPDVRAAVDWGAAGGHTEDALRLVGQLWRFWWAGARGDGLDAIRTALAGPGGSAQVRAGALVAGVLAASAGFDFGAAIQFGEAAVAVSADCGVDRVEARAHCWLAWMLVSTHAPGAERHLAIAEDLAGRAGDVTTLADTCNARAYLALEAGDPLTAIGWLHDVLAQVEATGNRITRCHALAAAAMARLMLGQLDAAEAAGAESLSAAMAMGDAMYTVVVLVTLARVAALRGDPAAAWRWAEEGAERAAGSGNDLLVSLAAVGIGMAEWASGDAAAAVESLEYSLPAVTMVSAASAVEIAGVLADARRAAGRAGPDDVAGLAIVVGGPWGRARACIADARATANPVAAHEALEIAATLDDRVTQVDALELLASHDSRRGAHRRAVELAAAAAAERNRLGYHASPLAGPTAGDVEAAATAALGADEVAVALSSGAALALAFAVAKARANHGRRGRPVSGWASLTPAERRVSELVADGLTNPQIAERLVVSRETVKGHVSSALRKLGARNRAELGVLATRQGAT